MLNRMNEMVLFLLAVGGFIVAMEAGYRMGRLLQAKANDRYRTHAASVQSSILGLLALLLGFNFAMAAARFDSRRSLEQDEVNAIATSYVRASLLSEPRRSEAITLMRSYVAARLDFARAEPDSPELIEATTESSRVENSLWRLAGADESVRSDALVAALTEMTNLKWRRYTSIGNHVPYPVTHLLFVVGLIAIGFVGFGYGLDGVRMHRLTAVYAVLVAMVLTITFDLDRPRGGLIRVGEDGLQRLQVAMDKDPIQ